MNGTPSKTSSDRTLIRWGLLGTGAVAEDFARALGSVEGAVKHAVAARDPQKARAFARRHGFESWHDSIDGLLGDPAVDVVYVSTPTRVHHEHGRRVLSAGKSLLCEKPFTRNEREAAEIVTLAKARGLFCMEGMWTRHNPILQECRRLVQRGDLGRTCAVTASIGYAKDLSALGGPDDGRGASAVFGCYGVSLSLFLFGPPLGWSSEVVRTRDGVDVTATFDLRYPSHTVSVTASVGATLSNELDIATTAANLHVSSPFMDATRMQVTRRRASRGVVGGAATTLGKLVSPFLDLASRRSSKKGSGFRGEILETMRCIREGLGESPVMPLDDTLAVHRILDEAGRAHA